MYLMCVAPRAVKGEREGKRKDGYRRRKEMQHGPCQRKNRWELVFYASASLGERPKG